MQPVLVNAWAVSPWISAFRLDAVAHGAEAGEGIRPLVVDPQGQKFDPNFQQAMYEVPDASVPAGTVVQVMQAGYTIGERVLRPALVGVAKGGAKPAPAANSNEAN